MPGGGGGGILTFKMGKYVPPYVKKKGAYGAAYKAEKVGAFRAKRTVKVVPIELFELGKMGAHTRTALLWEYPSGI